MSHQRRKRSHDESRSDSDGRIGVGQTLAYLQRSSDTLVGEQEEQQQDGTHTDQNGSSDGGGEWQVAESHRSKKRKKHANPDGGKYPSISHSSHNRLQSFVKVSDLQNLVLYALTDAPAPQWCAVSHHGQICKVVVLMVPGLEQGMFDGRIPLRSSTDEEETQASGDRTTDSSKLAEQEESEPKSNRTTAESASQPISHQNSHTSPDDYYPSRLELDQLPAPLRPLNDIFEHVWPVKAPGDDKYAKMHSPMGTMLIAPIVKPKEEKRTKGPQPPRESRGWKNERTIITEFIASTAELAEENYVLHPAHFRGSSSALEESTKRKLSQQTVDDGWFDTPNIPDLSAGAVPDRDIEKGAILAGRKVVSMDCEMCITSPAGTTPPVFSLTRISLLDWDGEVIMDEYVKPKEPITDYLTPYSGITAAKLEGVTTTLQDIQRKLADGILTPHTILIGHSLNSDLNALKLTHPFVIDTSLLFPHPRGPPLKSSLKWLAQRYLSREIQRGHGSTGHDSIEDARACLDLVKQKCEKGKAWGTSEASGESIFKRLARQKRPKRDKVHPDGDDEFRTGAVVDWGDPSRGYGASAKTCIGCESDEQIVAGVKRALFDTDVVGASPERGVDFVFARLRELEAHRGWWNRSKTLDNQSLLDNTTSGKSLRSLADTVSQTVTRIREVWEALPPCTAFIVFSGSGDPRELAEMQALQQQFKDEYRVKKWDELSVKWTDEEEQKLRKSCEKARKGIGFISVK